MMLVEEKKKIYVPLILLLFQNVKKVLNIQEMDGDVKMLYLEL
jgi:hypothetical protein